MKKPIDSGTVGYSYEENLIINNKSMTILTKYPILGSSADPEQVSLTIKSIGVWAIPALIAVITYFGLDITQNELVDLVNNLAILAATAMTVFGLFRKIYNKFIIK